MLGACVLGAGAEGYQVNTLSARQLGMAHTGTALKLGAESQFFNPAGMAFMTDRVQASASLNAIFATATAKHEGIEYKTDNTASTPFSAFAAFSIFDNFKAGVSLYTPYGSSINWTDNWPGAVVSQSVKLQAFTMQPTLSWRVTPRLAVGAGLTLTWGNVDLHKGLISARQLDGLLTSMGLPAGGSQITPASVALKGNANVAVGYNLGAMYDFTDNFTAGVNFRSKSMLKVKAGETKVEYNISNEVIKNVISSKLDGISRTQFSAEMPCPASLALGASWHNSRVTTSLETQLTFWKTYKTLDIEFIGAPEFNQHLAKNYHNAWLVRAGAEWKATKRLDLRAGLMVDFTPVDKEFYNPETPGMTKVEPSVGLTFRPLDCLGVNLGFMYVAGLGEDNASYTSPNVLTQQPDKFTADYGVHSFVASLGLSFSF